MIELPEKRGIHHKVFDLGQPNKFRLECSQQILHMPDDFARWGRGQSVRYLDVNPQWERQGANYQVTGTWYDFQVPAILSTMEFQSKAARGRMLVRLGALGAQRGGFVTVPEVEGDHLWFRNIAVDYDLCFIARPGRVQVYKKLKSPLAARSNEWNIEITNAEGVRANYETLGVDNLDKATRDPTQTDTRIQRAVELTQQVTREPNGSQKFIETWTGRTIKIDPTTRVRSVESRATYPIWIDFDLAETASAGNQGIIRTDIGSNGYYYADREQRSFPSTSANDGLWLFPNIAIAQGDTIDACDLVVDVNAFYANDTVDFGFIDQDTGAGYADAYLGAARKAQTTAQTRTTTFPSGTGSYANKVLTYSITASLQEIVDRAGWASGQSVHAVGEWQTPHGGAYFTWLFAPSSKYGKLNINFTAGGGGGPAAGLRTMTLTGAGI